MPPAESTGAASGDGSEEVATTRYRIDGEDRLRSVSGEWNAFAHQGGSDEITGDAVVGRPIWAFIGGEDVHHLFRILFSRVRESGRSIRVPFRCDAPDTRRWQSLELTPAADLDGGIDVVVRNLHEEARSPVRILDPEADRSEETLIVCAWCKRTRIAEHGWVDLEEAAEHLALFGTDPVPRLSHGICPDCRSLVETTATGDSGDI